ncbi:mechanosensitive ion channel family protein, partial [Kaarinaea lacus]
MPDFEFLNIGKESVWIVNIFLIVLAALSIDFFQRAAARRILRKFESTRNYWDDALVFALIRPVSLVIWGTGIYVATDIAELNTRSPLFDYADPVYNILVILAITWFLVRFIKRAEQGIIEDRKTKEEPVDITTVHAITKLLRLSVIITATLVVLQTLGFSVSGVLAFGGVGGIAVGFAARDLLANFFGGFMIYMDRP